MLIKFNIESFLVSVILSILLLLSSTSRATEVDSPQCIYFNVEECPNITDTEVCKCRKVGEESVVCCDIRRDFELLEGLACGEIVRQGITAVHIRNATLDKFDTSISVFNQLVSLSVTDSQIPRLVKSFGKDSGLTCLNLSNIGLNEFDPRMLKSLNGLAKIDLSHNNLTTLPDFPDVHKSHFILDVSDNPGLLCQSLSSVASKYMYNDSLDRIHFLNENQTSCVQPRMFHWFNSSDVVTFQRIKMKMKVDKECPKGDGYECACDIFLFEGAFDQPIVYTLAVDCSNKKLTSLPKPLPPYTVYLNVSSNNITQLDELSIDKSYTHLRYLYAEHNQIKSISVLEGSKFLDIFKLLSLKHNCIKTIPIYILSNAIDRLENYDRVIALGNNPLQCDCNTALSVKFWLQSNKKVIIDFNEVWCSNVGELVIDLDQTKVCIYQKEWSDYIMYIIVAEVLLLITLISKVLYDYWVFKSTGYLPWPASKIPKVPCCDWVFE